MNELLSRVPQMESVGGCEPERSIKTNLERQRTQLQERLDKINAALDALNKQPEVAELLESIIKVM